MQEHSSGVKIKMAKHEQVVEEFIREITRNQSAMTAYIRSLLPTHPDPRDILQEVNITLWKKRKQYQAGSNFKAWAFKVARFHVLNERRRMKKSHELVFDDDIINELSEGVEITVPALDSRLSALRVCQEKLRNEDRELLRVRYSEGVSIQQYAVLHEYNAGTVRAKLRNIRIKLKECITFQLAKEVENG